MADEEKFISSITLPNNEEYPIRDADAARSSHTHGNISTTGTMTTANRLVWTNNDKVMISGNHYATATSVAISSTAAPSENFYVNGSAQFNIGSSDGANLKRFIILGNGKSISIGGQGIQAFASGTTAKKLYILDWGGDLGIGENNKVGTLTFKSTTANISWDTASVTGSFIFYTSAGFNYAGIQSASTDSARNVWFSNATSRGIPVYNANFTYNPATPKLTLGAANITGSTSTTKSTDAFSILTLGNNKNKTTTDAHSQGKIVLYSGGTAAHTIVGTDTNTAYTLTLPAQTGTIAITDDIKVTSVTATGTAPLTLSATLSSKKVTITGSIAAATSAAAGVVLLGATDGAATFAHVHGNITNDGKMSGSTASGNTTTSHKFLREDGTWQVPKYTTNSDEKVKLTATTTAAAYKILLTTTSSPTSGTNYGSYYSTTFTYNPSSGALVVGGTITSGGYTVLTTNSSLAWSKITGVPSASSSTAGIIKVGTGANDALAGSTKYAGSAVAGGAASSVTITAHTNTTNGNKSYYPWFSTSSSGSLSGKAHVGFYIYETVANGAINKFDICVGSSSITGSLTLWDGTSHWGNIKAPSLSANRSYTLPNKEGTIALTSDFDNVSNNATLNSTTGNIGDMLYWSAVDTPARLSIGTENKILKSNGETPEWADEYQVEIIHIT